MWSYGPLYPAKVFIDLTPCYRCCVACSLLCGGNRPEDRKLSLLSMRVAQTSNTMFKGGSAHGLVAALTSNPTLESIKRFAPKFARLVELVQDPPGGRASPN